VSTIAHGCGECLVRLRLGAAAGRVGLSRFVPGPLPIVGSVLSSANASTGTVDRTVVFVSGELHAMMMMNAVNTNLHPIMIRFSILTFNSFLSC
jgi:hypothetical protein